MMEEDLVQVQETGEIIASSRELRRTVLELWQRIRIDWSYASEQLSKTFRARKKLAASARRAIAETLYAMIRNLSRVDHALSLGGRPSDSERDALRLWATLVLEFGLPIEVAANETDGIDWAAVAGVDELIANERDAVKRVSLAASLPMWLAEVLVKENGEAAFELATSMSSRAPMTVRANTLRTSRDELMQSLAEAGFETTAGRFSPTAISFQTRTNLFGLPEFKQGLFEAQDEGSQLIADLVAPPPKAKVVDFCAGAGGKALGLAALMGNRGRLIATDVAHRKLAETRRRAKRGGVDNVSIVTLPEDETESLPKQLEAWREKADRVLVDAPCTGIGALRRNPETRWRLSEDDLVRFPALQLGILERAYELVAVGGRLIYATCSIVRAENHEVIETFLARHPDLVVMSPKEIWGREKAAPLMGPDEQFLELTPSRHGTDGFFAAVLRRLPRQS